LTTSGSSGVESFVLATPARTSPIAFSVAPSRSSVCAQDACSRTLTWVYAYGLRSARFATPRNVIWCSLGEHEATTRPSSFFSWMSRIISCWVPSAHANIVVSATTTSGSSLNASRTLSTST